TTDRCTLGRQSFGLYKNSVIDSSSFGVINRDRWVSALRVFVRVFTFTPYSSCGQLSNRSSEEILFRRADPERSGVPQRVFHARFASGRRPREKEGARQSSSRVQANGNVAL